MARAIYRKVRLRKRYFDRVAEYPDIVLGFQLSRLSNALVTWMRMHVYAQRSVRRAGRLLIFKTRFDVTIQHAAVLYEVLKTFIGVCNYLPRFKLSSVDLFLVERWKRDFKDPNHIVCRIVKPIRNKIAFHFDHEVLTKLLRRYKFADDRVFAIGKTAAIGDSFYPASDDLILNFIMSRMPSEIPEADRYQAFQDQVVHLAGELAALINSIMLTLLKRYGYFRYEPL